MSLTIDINAIFHETVGKQRDGLTFQRLRGNIEYRRNKALLIETDTMPPGMNGYVVSLQNVDLICINPDLDDVLAQMTTFHEIGHLALGHLKETLLLYDEFLRNRDLQHAIMKGTNFHDPREQDAEDIGTLFLEAVLMTDNKMPTFARILYGEQ